MPNLKISQLTDGTPALNTDLLPVDRSGTNVSLSAGSIAALAGLGQTEIITSAVDANGNPNFLSGSGATITVNGSVTPLVYSVNGTKQTITTAATVTTTTPGSDLLFFIFAKKNSSGVATSSDLFATSQAPFWKYSSPATGGTANNPRIWFDLSTNTTKQSTGSAYAVIADSILLGVVIISSAPATVAVLCEPYRNSNFKRLNLFQDGSDGNAFTTTTVTAVGTKRFQSFAIDGGIYKHAGSNVGFLLVYSQTPVIITGSGTVGGAGLAANGGAGQASANGTAGTVGGVAGNGGGGGGAEATRSGGNGGAQALPQLFSTTNAGGTGGGPTANGNNATSIAVSGYDITTILQLLFNASGAGGGGGGGNGTGTGGSGGGGGLPHVIVAPAILVDTGSTVSAAGANGAAGTGTNSGGGGGGGGSYAILCGGFVTVNGTLTAIAGTGGNKAGGGGNGGNGGAGNSASVRLW